MESKWQRLVVGTNECFQYVQKITHMVVPGHLTPAETEAQFFIQIKLNVSGWNYSNTIIKLLIKIKSQSSCSSMNSTHLKQLSFIWDDTEHDSNRILTKYRWDFNQLFCWSPILESLRKHKIYTKSASLEVKQFEG